MKFVEKFRDQLPFEQILFIRLKRLLLSDLEIKSNSGKRDFLIRKLIQERVQIQQEILEQNQTKMFL